MLCDNTTVPLNVRLSFAKHFLELLYNQIIVKTNKEELSNLLTASHYIQKGLLPDIEAPLMTLFSEFLKALIQFFD